MNHVDLLIPNGLSDNPQSSQPNPTKVCAKVAWRPLGEKHQGHRKKIRPTKRVSFVGLFCLVRISEDASVETQAYFCWISSIFFRVAKFFFIEHFGATNMLCIPGFKYNTSGGKGVFRDFSIMGE